MANRNPYVGLRPFSEDESHLFFGRENQTLELLQRLHKHSFVAVVGSSGSGKSSLLRAGLIPALNGGFLVNNSDVWKVAIMKPGQRPLYNLAESILCKVKGNKDSADVKKLVEQMLARGASAIVDLIAPMRIKEPFNFFLLIDQFEEIFRFSVNQGNTQQLDEAIDFVDIFLELTNQKDIPFYVVLTMRSDFIGDCAKFHGLPEAMNKSQYLVPRLTREQLKKVIEDPVRLFGGNFDSALTSVMLNQIVNVEDELPLLQHALMRMCHYEAHVDKSKSIDLNDYERIGGIEKALSLHADEAYKELNRKDRLTAKGLFKGLTSIDEYGRKIRRPARLSELEGLTNSPSDKLMEVINHFVKDNRSFLMVHKLGDSSDKLIDISHESLIRQWSTLDKWVEQEDEKAKEYLKLKDVYDEFKSGSKLHLDDLELQKFVDWKNRFKPTRSWALRYNDGEVYDSCMAYIDESIKRQRRKKSRRRLLVTTTVMLMLAAAYIFVSRNIRERNKDNAFRLHENAQIQFTKDPTKALLLEMAAFETNGNQEYKDSALAIYNSGYSFYKIIDSKRPFSIKQAGDKIVAENVSPDYDRIMTEYASGRMILWDINGNKLLTLIEDNINAMVFSNDGSLCAVGGDNGQIKVWKTEDARTVWKIEDSINSNGVTSLAFSNDNKFLITGNEEGNVTMWDEKGNALYNKDLTDATEYSVTILKFSPNDSMVFGSSFLNSVVFTENELKELTTGRYDESGLLNAVSFHPTADLLVTGGKDRKVRIWDIDNNISRAFIGHKTEVVFVDFLLFGNETLVVSASLDNSILLWNLNGELLQQFVGHEGKVTSVVVGDDGLSMISRSLDFTTRMWTLNSDVLRRIYDGRKSINDEPLEEIIKNSPPELPLEQFLKSRAIETLSSDLRKDFNLN